VDEPGTVTAPITLAHGSQIRPTEAIRAMARTRPHSRIARVRPDTDCPFASGLTAQSFPERVEAILDGRILLPPHEPATLSWPPDWSADPFGDANWRFQLHALRWAQMLKRAYDHTGDEGLLERYLAILEDWYRRNPWSDPPSDQSWGDHSTALRARVYAACAQALEHAWPDWLRLALEEHVDVLSGPDLYPSGGNHALNQNVGLFAAASLLGRDDEVRIAIERTADLLERSVDDEGVTDEQSTEYQVYNYRRYREAVDLFASAGAELPPVFDRIALMPEMIAHATLPNGHDAMVGDSVDEPVHRIRGTVAEFAVTGGRRGPRPTDRVRVFQRGFVFARSGWGEDRPFDQETHLTVRFGPARIPHGHHDAGAIALYARGRRIISNAGKYAYSWDDFREYVLSRRAQNSLLLPEVPYSPDGGSTLVAADHDDEMLVVTIRDAHYPDVDLVRTVVFPFDGSGLVVADRFRHLDGTWSPRSSACGSILRSNPASATAGSPGRLATSRCGSPARRPRRRRAHPWPHRSVRRVGVLPVRTAGAGDGRADVLAWRRRPAGHRGPPRRRGRLGRRPRMVRRRGRKAQVAVGAGDRAALNGVVGPGLSAARPGCPGKTDAARSRACSATRSWPSACSASTSSAHAAAPRT
jgi:hypothetical protein